MTRPLIKNLDFIPFPFGPKFTICLHDGRTCTLDCISSIIFMLCDGTRTREEILQIISKQTLLDIEKLGDFITKLFNMGLIREVDIL